MSIAPINAADESPSTNKPGWINIPGGIADTAGHCAYVANASDGLTALDLQDGHTLWDTKAAIQPLALDGYHLIARAPRGQSKVNVLDLVIIDVRAGGVITKPQQLILPDWVSIDGGIGLKFSSTTAFDGHDLIISWYAERQFVGGVPPTSEAIAAAHKVESGKAQVNLENGESSVLIDDVPQLLKLPRAKAYYDVVDKRISSSDSPEDISGGVRIVHRLLDVRDAHTGRPLWHFEIAGDIILPPGAAEHPERLSNVQQLDRR
ncbi:MAG TPA: hypothetical protein VGI75_04720 [Pirellulales bacterium]